MERNLKIEQGEQILSSSMKERYKGLLEENITE